jgi:hypothetical protein
LNRVPEELNLQMIDIPGRPTDFNIQNDDSEAVSVICLKEWDILNISKLFASKDEVFQSEILRLRKAPWGYPFYFDSTLASKEI